MTGKTAKLEIQVDAETARAANDLEDLASSIAAIGDAAADSTAGLEDMTSAASAAAEDSSSALSNIVPVIDVTEILGQFGELAGKVGEVFTDQLNEAMSFEAGRGKLQAQLGATAEDAQRLGQLAADLYSEAWGDSIDDVNDAIRLVITNIGLTADDANLKPITTEVLALAQAFEVDLGGATKAVGVLMKTGLAANADDALDLITKGMQVAGDGADDLLDTITKSSVNLKTFGLTGKEAMGLIVQGLKAGAENADTITGLFEELVGNVASGGDELNAVFDSLGLDSKKLIDQLSHGGPDAAAGLDSLLDAIRNIEDPLKRSAAIAALFGEEGAALQGVLTSLDPSNAVQALGEVGGAAKTAADEVGTNAQSKFEAFKRSLETNVVVFIADNVIPGLTSLGDWGVKQFGRLGTAWDIFVTAFKGPLFVENGQLTSSITAVENMSPKSSFGEGSVQREIEKFGQTVRQLADEWLPKLTTALEDVRKKLEELIGWVRDNREALELLRDLGVIALIGVLITLGGVLVGTATFFAFLGLVIATMVAPIALLIRWIKDLGINWGNVWNDMVFAVRFAVFVISVWISELMFILSHLFDPVWPDDWPRFWDRIVGVVRTAVDWIKRLIGDIKQEINNFLDLIRRISNPFTLPTFGGNAVGPTALAAGPQMMTAAVPSLMVSRAPTVINVTISHTGLGVDSPRLQRDLVGALERYERREGPRRGH